MDDQYKKHYNNIAKKFGGFKSRFYHVSDQLPEDDPEEIFLELIKKYAGDRKVGLDVGAGDGQFTIKLAPYYKKTYAIFKCPNYNSSCY